MEENNIYGTPNVKDDDSTENMNDASTVSRQSDSELETENVTKSTSAQILNPNEITKDPDNSSFDKKAIMLLLSEYKKQIDRSRTAEIKEEVMWKEIAAVFRANGYNITPECIHLRFWNMQKRFNMIKRNNKRSTRGRRRIRWPYYTIMQKISEDDQSISGNQNTVSSLTPLDMSDSSSSSASSDGTSAAVTIYKRHRRRQEYEYRKKLTEIRRRSTQETNKIWEAIQRSNEIQEKALEMHKTLAEELRKVVKEKKDILAKFLETDQN